MKMLRRLKPAPATLGLLLLLPCCGQPQDLHIGPYVLPYQQVMTAEKALRQAFPHEGTDSLRAHLMLFGLGQANILHQTLPQKSQNARRECEKWLQRLRQGEDFLSVYLQWSEEVGITPMPDSPQLPNPAGLGAQAAAQVALMHEGDLAGPIQTSYGWEIIYLDKRLPGPSNRAQIVLYRMQFPVGSDLDRKQAKKAWETLPLSGNPELIQTLPPSFRLNRTHA